MPVDMQTFRRVMGSFPTGVAIVTTVDGSGAPKGLTSQSLIAVSTEPPLVLVSVDKTSRTLPALRESGAFVLNFVADGHENVVALFASKEEDKFANVTWLPSAVAKGAPLLTDYSVACAECLVTSVIEAGDHWLFIASMEEGSEFGGTPLMYYKRTYAGWPLQETLR